MDFVLRIFQKSIPAPVPIPGVGAAFGKGNLWNFHGKFTEFRQFWEGFTGKSRSCRDPGEPGKFFRLKILPGGVLSMEFCRVYPRKSHESDAVGIPGSDKGSRTMDFVNSAFLGGGKSREKSLPWIPTSNQGGFGAHPVGTGRGFGDGKLLGLGIFDPWFVYAHS